MLAAIALYPGFTALDAIGPYQVLSLLPGTELVFTAVNAGPLRDDTMLTVQIDRPISEIDRPDIVVVPGGLLLMPVLATKLRRPKKHTSSDERSLIQPTADSRHRLPTDAAKSQLKYIPFLPSVRKVQ